MIRIEKKLHGIPMITVWYAKEPLKDKGVIKYREARIQVGKTDIFDTLITDITESEEEIKSHFDRNCKRQINKAYNENVQSEILDGYDISDEELETFIKFFEDFWKSKGTELANPAELLRDMKAYRDAEALSISKALIDGEVVVYHTHLYDSECTRLYHSASLFREIGEDADAKKNLIGMANRMLHYEDMLFFKKKGLSIYDWGGAGKGEEVASITRFKETFGGTSVTYYDCEQVNGLKAKLVSLASNIKNRLR